MEMIRAAHNLTIELGPTSWRLTNGTADPAVPTQPVTLVEAYERQIRCAPEFAQDRHLPEAGALQPEDIARVIIGWAPESQSWHLGLLLAPGPEPGSKLRWCGLATWPSGPVEIHMIEAKLAGQSLARIIERPFYLVPYPRTQTISPDTQPLESTTAMPAQPALIQAPEIERKQPPFTFEDWQLDTSPNGLVWQRPTRWLATSAFRIVLFVVIAILFLLMGISSQTRGFASVDPGWLPFAGLALGVVLIVMAILHAWRLITVHSIQFDVDAREIRYQRRRDKRVQWRVPFDEVEYILLTQTQPRSQGHVRQEKLARIAQDLWLHIYDGQQFREIAALGRVEGESHAWDAVRADRQAGRRPLQLALFDTPAHHAALTIAQTIGCAVWLDQR